MNNFTPRSQQVLALSRKHVDILKWGEVDEVLILLGFLKLNQGIGMETLKAFNVEYDAALEEVKRQFSEKTQPKAPTGNVPYSRAVKKLLALANKAAKERDNHFVGTGHIMEAMFRLGKESNSLSILKGLGVNLIKFENSLDEELSSDETYGARVEDIKNSLEEKYIKGDSYGTESGFTRLEFTLWIDPGNARVEEIQELFEALSDLNHAHGGHGLSFVREESEEPLALSCY